MHEIRRKDLKILKRAKGAMSGKKRYKNCDTCEISDPEFWIYFNHVALSSPESNASAIPEVFDSERAPHATMAETYDPLTAREHRLEAERDETQIRGDVEGLYLIFEARGLRYNLPS
eukprot:s374_g25.t1